MQGLVLNSDGLVIKSEKIEISRTKTWKTKKLNNPNIVVGIRYGVKLGQIQPRQIGIDRYWSYPTLTYMYLTYRFFFTCISYTLYESYSIIPVVVLSILSFLNSLIFKNRQFWMTMISYVVAKSVRSRQKSIKM